MLNIVQLQKNWLCRSQLIEIYHTRIKLEILAKKGANFDPLPYKM